MYCIYFIFKNEFISCISRYRTNNTDGVPQDWTWRGSVGNASLAGTLGRAHYDDVAVWKICTWAGGDRSARTLRNPGWSGPVGVMMITHPLYTVKYGTHAFEKPVAEQPGHTIML